MKGFLVVLVFLLIIGGVVFYFGWLQIHLDEDSYAVVFTKTGGWEDDVISPGTFEWRGAKLLPTNLALHVFPIKNQVFQTTLRGSLPGATTYASLLETAGAFSYAVTVTVSYQIEPTRLPTLVRTGGLRSEELDRFYQGVNAEIQQVVTESVTGSFSGTVTPASASATIREDLDTALARRFPDLRIVSTSVTRVDLPDLELYAQVRSRYSEILDTRTNALKAAAQELAPAQTQMEAGLSRLERYGEILDRYPILLDYFSLSQENPDLPLDLEALIPVPPQ